MKPSEKCKLAGLKSLDELSKISGESSQTLINWFKLRPFKFDAILIHAVRYKQNKIGETWFNLTKKTKE